MALRHARIAVHTTRTHETHIVRELRGQLTKYALGLLGAARMRDQLVRAETLHDIEALLVPIAEGVLEVA